MLPIVMFLHWSNLLTSAFLLSRQPSHCPGTMMQCDIESIVDDDDDDDIHDSQSTRSHYTIPWTNANEPRCLRVLLVSM